MTSAGLMVGHALQRYGSLALFDRGHERWTYDRIGMQARRLASLIGPTGSGTDRPARSMLVAGDDVVGFTICLLAGWLTGYTVVPAPAGSPPRRLRQVLEDAEPAICAGPPGFIHGLAEQLPDALPGVRLLPLEPSAVDDDPWPADRRPGTEFDARCDPAVVLFTSGSTGRAKGVQLTDEAVGNYLTWARSAFDVRPGSRVPALLPVSFDVGLSQVLVALVSGGTVLVAGDAAPVASDLAESGGAGRSGADPDLVDRLLVGPAATVLFTTPTFALDLVRRGRRLPALEHVLLAGEPLRYELVGRLRSLLPSDCVITNGYGPTEATVLTTAYRLPGGRSEPATGAVPLGEPVAGAAVHLGTDGEIMISGPGVSPGYVRRPELDAQAFATRIDSSGAPVRVYRTGDLAERTADGELVMTGRVDDQVKIRGFRVEPAEVALALTQLPAVHDCAVLAVRRGTTDTLSAFVVPRPGHELTELTVRRWLVDRLPAYMVPSRIRFVADLPRNANGKLDRGALLHGASEPRPDAADGELAETEAAIAAIFERHLGRPIDRDLGFFEAGGSSLQLTAVLAELRELTGRPTLGVDTMFAYPSVTALAARLCALDDPTAPRPSSRRTPTRRRHNAPA